MQRNNNYNKTYSKNELETKSVTQNDVNLAMKEIAVDYTVYAEKVIKQLFKESHNLISTSQLRSIYSLIAPLLESCDKQNEEMLKNSLRKIKIKIAYQIGRDSDKNAKLGTNDFNKATSVLELISKVLESSEFKKDLQLYLNYWEALVAYHKYYDLVKKEERNRKEIK